MDIFGRTIKGSPPATHLVVQWREVPLQERLAANFACGHGAFQVDPVDADDAENFCDACLLADLGPAVYRIFDPDGALIYIGSSGNLLGRFAAHRGTTPWWQEARSYSLEFHPDLSAARAAEKRAIAAEYPLYNVADKAPDARNVMPAGGAA